MSDVNRQTEHPTLQTQPLPPSNADPSHQTPAERRRGVGLGTEQRVRSTPTKNATCKENTSFLGTNIKLEFLMPRHDKW